jgi:dipeptidyl aminopeptidase/acylaminoacyl peptidase
MRHLALFAVLVLPSVAVGRPMVPADLNALVEVSDPRVSPDGNDIAYVVTTTDVAADRTESHIWLAHWNGAPAVRLTGRPGESESHPRFTADGKYLAFLSSRTDAHEHDQIFLLPRAGGEAEKLTDMQAGVDDFSFAPDSTHVALIATDADPADGAKVPLPIVIDRYRFKEDVTGYLTERRHRLYLLSLADRKPVRLTTGAFDEYFPVFSPDSQSIAFVSNRQPDPDRSYNYALFLVPARAGATVRGLTTFPGANNDPYWETPPAFSPDGKKIAYLQGGPIKLMEYGVHQLAIVPTEGGAPLLPLAKLDRNVTQPAWSADGGKISVLAEDDGAVRLISFDVATSTPVAMSPARGVVEAFDQAAGHMVVLVTTPQHPAEIYAQEGTALRPLTHHNDALLAGLDLATTARIDFPSRDGTRIHGFLVTPPGAAVPKRPTILRIHGGPQLQFELAFRPDWQILAGHGYQVVAANPRGSTGRGEAFASAIYADWGNKDAQDVLAAVDYVVTQNLADPARLGVGGWSYGGMLTDYVIAQDKRFRVAIAGASIGDIIAGYGTDEYVRDYETELGHPWDNLATWEKISFPFLHNDRIVTPTLFLCGDKDFNVPLQNSEQMYQGLRSRGVPTELVIYPGEYHDIKRPSFLVDRLTRYLAWYDRYLK